MGRPFSAAATATRKPWCRGTSLAIQLTVALLLLLLLAASARAYAPGQLIYAKRIGSSASQAGAWELAAGPNGTAVIAGWKEVAPAGSVPMVAKYSDAGKRAWLKTYAAGGQGHADAVACDRAGNVYVAATVNLGTGGDIAVIKYGPAGRRRWTQIYDGGGGADEAWRIAVDPSGNVVVLGRSVVTGKLGIVALKYDATGNPVWPNPTRWDPPASDPDVGDYRAEDLALDAAGNVYVAGSATYVGAASGVVFKAYGADGHKGPGWLYTSRHAPQSSFSSIAVRGSELVAVGSVWDPAGPENGLVVKFDLDLTEKYWKEWGTTTQDWFSDVVLDGKGNAFVTGSRWVDGPSGYEKAVAMKLNARLSKVVWQSGYLPPSKQAVGLFIARDDRGNVYVAGARDSLDGDEDVVTMKYSPWGVRKWRATLAGAGGDNDRVEGLVLGSRGGVYVDGWGKGKGGILQAFLLKYQR